MVSGGQLPNVSEGPTKHTNDTQQKEELGAVNGPRQRSTTIQGSFLLRATATAQKESFFSHTHITSSFELNPAWLVVLHSVVCRLVHPWITGDVANSFSRSLAGLL